MLVLVRSTCMMGHLEKAIYVIASLMIGFILNAFIVKLISCSNARWFEI